MAYEENEVIYYLLYLTRLYRQFEVIQNGCRRASRICEFYTVELNFTAQICLKNTSSSMLFSIFDIYAKSYQILSSSCHIINTWFFIK